MVVNIPIVAHLTPFKKWEETTSHQATCYDIEIKVKPAAQAIGRLALAV